MNPSDEAMTIKPTDLRGILNYVPKFLGQTFVIALDGSIIEHENLPNLLLDVAVMRSLQINVVIVHGIGKQLLELGRQRDIQPSDILGSGRTSSETLDLAIRASSRVSHQILEALTKTKLKCAITNSVRAKPIGVLKGEDYEYTGKTEQIDRDFLNHLIDRNIIPIIQPIGFDRDGRTLRINSDSLAIDVALTLHATKVIYLTNENGLHDHGVLKRQIPAEDLEAFLNAPNAQHISASLLSKSKQALRGIKADLARIHILDGRQHDGLIREVFSNEGVGTLIYANEYQQIRQATRDDVPLIYHLTRSGVAKEELVHRSMSSIGEHIESFYVYEIDGNIMACVLLDQFEDAPETREICSLFVHPLYQKQGIGRKLVRFATHRAAELGAKRVIALSTQSYNYFKEQFGFLDVGPEALPPSRKARYDASLRKSKILEKLFES